MPEKGPHLAARAARLTGRVLRIAGRIGDAGYFQREVSPLLGDGVEYLGACAPAGADPTAGGMLHWAPLIPSTPKPSRP